MARCTPASRCCCCTGCTAIALGFAFLAAVLAFALAAGNNRQMAFNTQDFELDVWNYESDVVLYAWAWEDCDYVVRYARAYRDAVPVGRFNECGTSTFLQSFFQRALGLQRVGRVDSKQPGRYVVHSRPGTRLTGFVLRANKWWGLGAVGAASLAVFWAWVLLGAGCSLSCAAACFLAPGPVTVVHAQPVGIMAAV
uniref:Uncharacterized protein n=1 Tax=Zooxanthella nutricula TaxID=1333877 RepID=A0A7S2QCL2_9DINO